MKKGSRVTVKIDARKRWHGKIVGETRDCLRWIIVKDGTAAPRPIEKRFCREFEHVDSVERTDHRSGRV